ncbi:MAG: Dna2/Cas4 domain-containing protein [Methanobrevibacter sp.]|nr:Dna2/Cas4 domain-containing protein [Methanobrevibacter sp.]
MISVSTIKSYMFCPLKLYFQSNIDESEEDYFISKTLKDLRIDIQDILHKNLRHIKKDMDETEIEKRLAIGINNQIKTTFEIIEEINEKNKEEEEEEEEQPKKDDEIEFIDQEEEEELEKEEDDELNKLKKELINEINLNLKILSLKVSQSMKVLDKDGSEIQNLFFPTSMYNYLIRDIGLDMIGIIDKIEVEKGNYFPISLKSSNPPVNGVWDGDFMEAIANALLIEQEFNTYVTVAYVDYLKIANRRAVIIDTDARKCFFKVLTNVNKIVETGEIPTVKTGLKKCENCEYKELCDNS